MPDDYVSEVLPSTGEKLQVTINKEYAYEVLDSIMEAYLNNEPPYNLYTTHLLHDPRRMPKTLERGTKDHAMLLFNVCYYMCGGIKSNGAFPRMAALYDDMPELFNCEAVQNIDEEIITQALTDHGLGFQQTVAKQWPENSRRLQEHFDGDPRNIFNGVTNYEQSLALAQNDHKDNGFLDCARPTLSLATSGRSQYIAAKPF